jgi:hypothetical protein
MEGFWPKRSVQVINWREITRRRVAAGWILEAIDELKDGHAGLTVQSEAAAIDELALESREETLAHGVVVWVPDRARRRPACLRRLPEAIDVH